VGVVLSTVASILWVVVMVVGFGVLALGVIVHPLLGNQEKPKHYSQNHSYQHNGHHHALLGISDLQTNIEDGDDNKL